MCVSQCVCSARVCVCVCVCVCVASGGLLVWRLIASCLSNALQLRCYAFLHKHRQRNKTIRHCKAINETNSANYVRKNKKEIKTARDKLEGTWLPSRNRVPYDPHAHPCTDQIHIAVRTNRTEHNKPNINTPNMTIGTHDGRIDLPLPDVLGVLRAISVINSPSPVKKKTE